jgi:hypothetical protein
MSTFAISAFQPDYNLKYFIIISSYNGTPRKPKLPKFFNKSCNLKLQKFFWGKFFEIFFGENFLEIFPGKKFPNISRVHKFLGKSIKIFFINFPAYNNHYKSNYDSASI